MKQALFISVTLNFLIVAAFVGKRYYYYRSGQASSNVSSYPFDNWNQMRASTYDLCKLDSNDIVFVGNSLTEAFPVSELFGPHVKNRGIGGNKTSHILNRIGDIAKCHPRKLFIEAGVNDIVFGNSVDSAFNNYVEIIKLVKQTSPKTLINVQSILPTCKDYEKYNEKVLELNKKLRSYCDFEGVRYIDIYNHVVLYASLDSTLTSDGIHLNGKGYNIWYRILQKHMQ